MHGNIIAKHLLLNRKIKGGYNLQIEEVTDSTYNKSIVIGVQKHPLHSREADDRNSKSGTTSRLE